jgi:hypothetical protein
MSYTSGNTKPAATLTWASHFKKKKKKKFLFKAVWSGVFHDHSPSKLKTDP